MATVSLHSVYLIFLLVIGLNGEDEFLKDEDVLVLSVENFETAIASNEHLLVMFYAPWCSHSQAMMKDFGEAAKKLAEDGSSTRLAKIDISKNPAIHRKYNIRGYPTVKLFTNGQISRDEYTGDRDAESLISFVKSHSSRTSPFEVNEEHEILE